MQTDAAREALPVLAEVTRSGWVESRHRGVVVVVDTQGTIHRQRGPANWRTYMRSAAKPVQAVPLIESGAADSFRFTEEELAICCASHTGEEIHQQVVQSVLQKIGQPAEALACGVHPPTDSRTRRQLVAAGRRPNVLHHNCSGKHGGMLAVCVHRDWPVAGYRSADHPLQREIVQVMSELTGCSIEDIHLGVDGCGVPVFGLPLSAMARVFAILGTEGQAPRHGEALRRIREAMTGNPYLIAGRGQFDTALMQQCGERVVAKSGAEGVFCCGVIGRGLGIVIKMEDGYARALPSVALQCLLELNVVTEADLHALSSFFEPEVRNAHDELVGHIRAVRPLFA